MFECIFCDYKTSRKSQITRHNSTDKHIILTNPNKKSSDNIFQCGCGKIYKHQSTLCAHRKKSINTTCNNIYNNVCNNVCNNYKNEENILIDNSSNTLNTITSLFQEQLNENKKLTNIILDVVKENKELNELMRDQRKQLIITNNSTNSNNTINNTNNFNLHFFLNEKCKDALNIEDFVNQIKLQISDLDMIGKVGYVEGITKIFLKNLKLLDICKRPIHCSDLKREILYVKDKDSWEKENDENKKIKNAIKKIEDKNIDQLPQWMDENPAYNDYDSTKHMDYHHILIESMGGSSNDDDDKNKNKIVRNISKEVFIDKKSL